MRSPRFEPEWVEAAARATASGAVTSIHYKRADHILRALEGVGALRAEPAAHEVVVAPPTERGSAWLTWSCSCGEESRFDFARLSGAVEEAEGHVPPDQRLVIIRVPSA